MGAGNYTVGGRYSSSDQSYSQWKSARLDNVLNDRWAEDAKEIKGEFITLRATAESGFIGYLGPMSYEKAYWEKRHHDKAQKHDEPFPSVIEIAEWKGKRQVKKQAKKAFGWMKGRTFLKKKK